VTEIRQNLQFAMMMILLLGLAVSVAAQEQTVDVEFAWAACPTEDVDGKVCAAAVRYEVFLQKGGGEAEMLASVDDGTRYTLAAERGVVQRVRVVGYDIDDRPSEPSEWSDPIYFEIERSAEGPHGPPPTAATLNKNYPNPFNPETSILYGIPEDVAADTRMSLEIFNLRGERVRSLEVESTPGWHEVMWNGTDDGGRVQATGTYVTRFICGDRVEVGKMTMVK